MIPGDLLSACPHRQFHTLPGLLDSRATLPNSYPNALRAMQGGSLYHLYDGLWHDPAERRTHDLPCERRTRYRLSQPDTVSNRSRCHCIKISRPFRNTIFEIVYTTKMLIRTLTVEDVKHICKVLFRLDASMSKRRRRFLYKDYNAARSL